MSIYTKFLTPSNSGALSYDADGNGATASIQIALIGVTTHPTNIDYTDFVIV